MSLIRSLFPYIPAGDDEIPKAWTGLAELGYSDQAVVSERLGNNLVSVIEVERLALSLGRSRVDGVIGTEAVYSVIADLIVGWSKRQEIFDLLVIGQTRAGEEIIRTWLRRLPEKKLPFLVIRFSVFYGDQTFSGYGPKTQPKSVGYHYDFPKDLHLLCQLLIDEDLIEAIANRSRTEVARAINQFNQHHSDQPPILAF